MRTPSLYVDRASALHELHPSVKLAGLFALFVLAFRSASLSAAFAVAGGVGLLLVGSGGTTNVVRLRFLFAAVFVMTFVLWCFFYTEGDRPYPGGAPAYALLVALKLTTLLGVGVLFLSTTKVEEFTYALVRLGVPYRFGFAVSLSFRLVPVFLDAALTVVEAQKCRGLSFDEGSPFERLRRYAAVIVPVFMSALRRADHMAQALEARGFQRTDRPSVYRTYAFRPRDAAALVVLAAALVFEASFG
ncbi:MAG: hypothetical protein KatS3mg076_1794 [Candidatus Binatia bacterium]|nr:MAG: hypothetical protein KatS3mg076_1794 [Candidatus Binatia bacterium]